MIRADGGDEHGLHMLLGSKSGDARCFSTPEKICTPCRFPRSLRKGIRIRTGEGNHGPRMNPRVVQGNWGELVCQMLGFAAPKPITFYVFSMYPIY
jgi:hypothetical protein